MGPTYVKFICTVALIAIKYIYTCAIVLTRSGKTVVDKVLTASTEVAFFTQTLVIVKQVLDTPTENQKLHRYCIRLTNYPAHSSIETRD